MSRSRGVAVGAMYLAGGARIPGADTGDTGLWQLQVPCTLKKKAA